MARRLSRFFWGLAIGSVTAGFGFGMLSGYLAIHLKSGIEIFFMVGCALFLALAGGFATVASKFESEGK